MNHGYTYSDSIRKAHEGMTVLEFYSLLYDEFTNNEWRARIESGQIWRNGVEAASGDLLVTGDTLEYRRPPWEEPDVPVAIPVLFEDDSLAVFHKPDGLPVLPGGGYLENTMLHLVRKRFGQALSPIHRLGRGTTGAILFTKNPLAAAVLSKAMREGTINKTYLALVQGNVGEDAFTVDAPIGYVPHPLLGRVYASMSSGKSSLSHVTVLERRPSQKATLVQVNIPTGRPHQIRIHMACAGHPLTGDPLYAPGGGIVVPPTHERAAVPGDCGYLLHSWKIVFPHPVSGERLCITAPPAGLLIPPQ